MSTWTSNRAPLDGGQLPPDGSAGGQPPQPPTFPLHPSGDGAQLSDYLRVLYKRRWMALSVFFIIVIGDAVVTFTATPVYEATTRLLIESDTPNVVTFKQVIEEQQAQADYYQTQYNILQSRALARKTLDAQKLWARFGKGAAPAPEPWWRRVIPGSPAPVPQTPAQSETAAEGGAVSAFLSSLTITPIRNSRLVDVKFRSSDPDLATRAVNELASSYIKQNLEYRFTASREASDWLEQQLAQQKKAVENAETALQRYREQNDAISMEDRENIVVQKLADLSSAVTKAKTERLQKEAQYRQLAAIQNDPAALDTFPAILNNQFLQQQRSELASLQRQRAQLAERLGDRHPDMTKIQSAIQTAQARIDNEIAKIVQGVRSEFQAAAAQEQSMSGALEQQKTEAMTMNRRAIEYSVLERDVESSKQIYDSLMQRAKETGISGELRTSNIRVVDPAELPRSPATPNKRVNMLLGLFGGTVLAFGLVFLFEHLDSRIKTPDDIRKHLGLPALGLLPMLPKAGAVSHPLITNGVPPNFSEAFRSIRTNLIFSAATEGSRSLVVTSTAPGEGKTLVACNLAIALAQSGQRVLIIDADMRRPKVHEAYDLNQEPGLSNILVGDAKVSETIRKATLPSLWVLPAGHVPPNPAELLGSTRFRDFMASLGQHFDWVIVDTPPVMAVTDAPVIAPSVSAVLFVVGADMTSRHLALRAVEQLDAVKARFAGAVLNRADIDRNPYYYANYYRREYSNYYRGEPVAQSNSAAV
jgi:polysaccharide biosynthesis transport protein